MSLADAPRHCTVPGCRQRLVRGQLMCFGHWTAVPQVTRDEVWASWRAYQPRACRGQSGYEIARRSMRYSAAVQAAAAHAVRAELTPDALTAAQIAFRERKHAAAKADAKAEPESRSILTTVEGFLKRTGVSASRFGRDAVRDSKIVFEMRQGRAVSDRVSRRLAHFMRKQIEGGVL